MLIQIYTYYNPNLLCHPSWQHLATLCLIQAFTQRNKFLFGTVMSLLLCRTATPSYSHLPQFLGLLVCKPISGARLEQWNTEESVLSCWWCWSFVENRSVWFCWSSDATLENKSEWKEGTKALLLCNSVIPVGHAMLFPLYTFNMDYKRVKLFGIDAIQ